MTRVVAVSAAIAALVAGCGGDAPPAATGGSRNAAGAPVGTSPPLDGRNFVSVGRGAPELVPLDYPRGETESFMRFLERVAVVGAFRVRVDGAGGEPDRVIEVGAAFGGDAPDGIEPLPVDLFTTTNFYADREYWSDPRYFRCHSSTSLELHRGAYPGSIDVLADGDLSQAAWGDCSRDYPREAIVSPYDFDTAEAHYNALLEETRRRGGPTEHTYATVPGEWTGQYGRINIQVAFGSWYGMLRNQIPTILSLLTDEYQTHLVQSAYHEGVTNTPQWPAQYCWPEGFMRRFHMAATGFHNFLVTPDLVQVFTSSADNFLTNIHIGREFDMSGNVPRLGADVPRWYGETIGFWDGDALITWTSNVQGWMSHGNFEFSNRMQTIEIYTPNRDVSGRFVGLHHEAILYDEDALVEPVRIMRDFDKVGDLNEVDPLQYVECVRQIFPMSGRAQAVAPGNRFDYKVPDMYGRPWAELWRDHFEEGMQPPGNESDDIFSFE